MVVTKCPVDATFTLPQAMISVNSVALPLPYGVPVIGMVTVYCSP